MSVSKGTVEDLSEERQKEVNPPGNDSASKGLAGRGGREKRCNSSSQPPSSRHKASSDSASAIASRLIASRCVAFGLHLGRRWGLSGRRPQHRHGRRSSPRLRLSPVFPVCLLHKRPAGTPGRGNISSLVGGNICCLSGTTPGSRCTFSSRLRPGGPAFLSDPQLVVCVLDPNWECGAFQRLQEEELIALGEDTTGSWRAGRRGRALYNIVFVRDDHGAGTRSGFRRARGTSSLMFRRRKRQMSARQMSKRVSPSRERQPAADAEPVSTGRTSDSSHPSRLQPWWC